MSIGNDLGRIMVWIRFYHRRKMYDRRNAAIRRYDDIAFARWRRNHSA